MDTSYYEKHLADVAAHRADHVREMRRYGLYRAEREFKHPEKVRAKEILNRTVHSGQLVRRSTCEICGSGGKIEGHHQDYTQPLVVMWLCPTCHRQQHVWLRELGV